VLAWISPDIGTFFLWQAIVAAGHLVVAVNLLWGALPASDHRPRFSWNMMRGSWRFAAGMTGITITAVIATQLDKVLLSGLLSLEMFGYYSLAAVLAGGLRIVATPMFDALFPRFSALIALGDQASLQSLYHRSAQLMSTLMIPLAAVLSLFAYEVVNVWTRSELTATQTMHVLALLALGTGINGLWLMPYALQLAMGWTSLAFGLNAALIAAFVPALILLTSRYGSVGAAGAWVGFNSVGLLVASGLTHRRVLQGEWPHWAWHDVGMPLLATIAVVLLVRVAMPTPLGTVGQVAWLGGALLTAMGAAFLSSNRLRSWAAVQLSQPGPTRR
jgi:O-antigen/teichoic acid export membrane protein